MNLNSCLANFQGEKNTSIIHSNFLIYTSRFITLLHRFELLKNDWTIKVSDRCTVFVTFAAIVPFLCTHFLQNDFFDLDAIDPY